MLYWCCYYIARVHNFFSFAEIELDIRQYLLCAHVGNWRNWKIFKLKLRLSRFLNTVKFRVKIRVILRWTWFWDETRWRVLFCENPKKLKTLFWKHSWPAVKDGKDFSAVGHGIIQLLMRGNNIYELLVQEIILRISSLRGSSELMFSTKAYTNLCL